jgi:Secretion system C-terminal sorting domain/YHYH protein
MKIKISILLLIILSNFAMAHDGNEVGILQHFTVANKNVSGYFSMLKNQEVYIETTEHQMVHFPLSNFSVEQQEIFKRRYSKIKTQNAPINAINISGKKSMQNNLMLTIFFLGIVLILLVVKFSNSILLPSKMKFIYPILLVGTSTLLLSAAKKVRSTSDPLIINEAFAPYVPNVATHWDATWFYVESNGIPTTHNMMVGIGSNGWQQQVPLPHCYVGASAWQVPLNPTMATVPVPVDANHFTKGAIAIAVNGVPIFNPYTNTGADAFLTGQLDNFGGHCGRGDDYHYHTAPMHLYTSTNDTLPIAYALDGYAVRGSKEHDGTAMAVLDANHGHSYGGVYHYHGSAAAPYMIKNMAGVVTEDANKQIIPQPQGQPVRTENWTPLNNALITACTQNATQNGYTLTYSLNGVNGYSIDYNWTGTTYTFNYITPSGSTSKTYTGPNLAQCQLPNATINSIDFASELTVFPNPTTDLININLGQSISEKQIAKTVILNMQGCIVYESLVFDKTISTSNFPKGNYLLQLQIGNNKISKTLQKK